ncbi:stage II sporulation protein M [Mycobacteroides chelonae]|uniref:stage II sporulation protein M n=1 Tax=Mycobacteroides chelonae TaxID=1774 RepID=UPI000991C7B5|nr:stage II sporulation protein M [Mycobacteroides chelonae]
MDVDAFVATHRGTWDRLELLLKRRRSLSGPEIDELVELYQRVSTHLSTVRSSSGDPALVGRLSNLVARARSAVTGEHAPLWRHFIRFWTVSFPVVAYRSWRWWLGATVASMVVAVAVGIWVMHSAELQSVIGTPDEIAHLVNEDFENYYSEHPAAAFALHVWINNSWVAAQCIIFAVLLGIPIPFVLFMNAANVGVAGGLMIAAGRGDVFFGLILPHGLLELTAVFLAAGAGMRLGWKVIDPGDRPRGQVLAEQGRAVMSVAGGLVGVLLVSGLIEALVTPSPLPTFARVAIGVIAEALFLAYVVILGRRGVAANESGDVEDAPDYAPAS